MFIATATAGLTGIEAVLTILIPAITGVISSFVTYMVTKNNNRKDLKVNEIDDRRQLSKDQIELISELRDMITGQRSDINKLRNEIKQLQNVNFNLTLENLHLQGKIDKLTERLQIFEENNEIKEAREMKDKGEDLE